MAAKRKKLGFEERRQREHAAHVRWKSSIDSVRAAVKPGDTVRFYGSPGTLGPATGRVLEADEKRLVILDKHGNRPRVDRTDVLSIVRAAPKSKRAPGRSGGRGHMLDRVGAKWQSSPYVREVKPLALMTDKEIVDRFGVRDAASAIGSRNVARAVAAALTRAMRIAKLDVRSNDGVAIASKQIRTAYDGRAWMERSRDPFKIWIWFENGGPLADGSYYPDFARVYDIAVDLLKKQGFTASWDSQNAAMSYIRAVPQMWA